MAPFRPGKGEQSSEQALTTSTDTLTESTVNNPESQHPGTIAAVATPERRSPVERARNDDLSASQRFRVPSSEDHGWGHGLRIRSCEHWICAITCQKLGFT